MVLERKCSDYDDLDAGNFEKPYYQFYTSHCRSGIKIRIEGIDTHNVLCPFCSGNGRTFTFNSRTGLSNCSSCGWQGDVVAFAKKIKESGIDVSKELEKLITQGMSRLDYAKAYVRRGFSVIPIRPKDKRPALGSWAEFQNRKPTEQELLGWFSGESKNNLGIVTGKISGLAVIDLDCKKAVRFAKDNKFPKTPLVKTANGFHYYYNYKDGVRNFQKRDDLPGIDLRGDGGYVVAPPSIHPSGQRYSWVKGKGLDDRPLAELPEVILAQSPDDKKPIKELCRGVNKGERNVSLARLVGSWVNDGLDYVECLENARIWNSKNKPPLPESEVQSTVKSIFEKHHRNASWHQEKLRQKQKDSEDVSRMIEEGVDYDKAIKAIAQIPLEGEKEKCITVLGKRDNIRKEAIRKDIQDRLKGIVSTKRSKDEDIQKLTEEEKEEAIALLQDENFLDKFLDTTEQLGCVGEENNKVILYLSLTSRIQDDPINIIVKGESSAGKSYLVESVSQFFSEDHIRQFTALSAKALFHRKDILKHKVLIVYERSGAEESDYSIRTLQSEKKLIFSTPVKNPMTNAFETEDIVVEGPIAYVETTTKTHIHPENETRCFEIFIDESEEQTKRIYDAQNKKHEIMVLDREAILKPWKNAQRLLKSYPVYILYIELIEFPTKPLRVRRDRPKFLALIEASALLRQHQREKKMMNGKEFIVADIEDYTIAYSLANKVLESVLKGLSPKVKELIEVANGFDGGEFTNKDLRQKVTWNEKTLEKYVREALHWGYFEVTQEGGKGKAYHYKLVKTDDSPIGLLTPEELKGRITSISSNPQLGSGDFNPLISQENQLNPQLHQDSIKDGGI